MTGGVVWTRRACLGAALTLPFKASAATPRVVALDWGWAATLIGLGLRPAGVAEQRGYRDWVATPALPPDTPEVGLRTDPSLETLAALRPDLILTGGLNDAIRPALDAIAPTLPNPTFSKSRTPLVNSKAAARLLGQRLGCEPQAEALVRAAETRIEAARDRLQALTGRGLLPLTMVDSRHFTLYGRGSLFADVLSGVGLHSLWTGATSLWGHATRPVTTLASLPPGDLLVVAPVQPAAARVLEGPGLLTSLCQADGRRILRVPPAWAFGDISAAGRFADLLAEALAGEEPA